MSESKGQFNSNFGFIMASVGSAVGLGNIWGFPYKLGKSGGFAFLFFYLLLVFLVGAVIMLGEFTLGRKTGKAPIQAYGSIGSGYSILGIMAVASAFIIPSHAITPIRASSRIFPMRKARRVFHSRFVP